MFNIGEILKTDIDMAATTQTIKMVINVILCRISPQVGVNPVVSKSQLPGLGKNKEYGFTSYDQYLPHSKD